MSFPIEPPMNTPAGGVVLNINTVSRRETLVAVPPANVEEIFDSFMQGDPFTITSTVHPLTGKFVKVAVNPALIEFMRVELDAPQENGNVRSIQRIRPFDPEPADGA